MTITRPLHSIQPPAYAFRDRLLNFCTPGLSEPDAQERVPKVAAAFSYNSELPGGRAPFWIKDDSLSGLGLHRGDAVSVDSSLEPKDGDLVLVEVAVEDESSERTVRRYYEDGGEVTLKAANPDYPDVLLPSDQVFVVGVVRTRVRFEPVDRDLTRIVEEPLE